MGNRPESGKKRPDWDRSSHASKREGVTFGAGREGHVNGHWELPQQLER